MEVPRFYCRDLSPDAVELAADEPRRACEGLPLQAGDAVELDRAESRHARRSLRLRAGDAVELFDGQGGVARGRIFSDGAGIRRRTGGTGGDRRAGKRLAAIRVRIDTLHHEPPPSRNLTLVLAGCKGPRLDFLVEKGTELGVTGFLFAPFARSVVEPGPGHLQKLRRTALEACKQCGRNHAPAISAADDACAAVRAACTEAGTALVVAHRAEDAPTLGQWLRCARPEKVIAVIGPEGGLADAELATLAAQGAVTVRLGIHTLRLETAALAVAATFASG